MKIQQLIKLDNFDYYKRHFSIINNLLPVNITDKEIDVLAAFLSLSDSNILSSNNRKQIKDLLNISDQSISNYISSLLKKNVLYKENNNLKIKSFLIPDKSFQEYQIVITNTDNFTSLS